jgi:hypothetical protein
MDQFQEYIKALQVVLADRREEYHKANNAGDKESAERWRDVIGAYENALGMARDFADARFR